MTLKSKSAERSKNSNQNTTDQIKCALKAVESEIQAADRETMKLILNSEGYRGRSRKLNFKSEPEIVIPGDKEVQLMKKQKRQFGQFST